MLCTWLNSHQTTCTNSNCRNGSLRSSQLCCLRYVKKYSANKLWWLAKRKEKKKKREKNKAEINSDRNLQRSCKTYDDTYCFLIRYASSQQVKSLWFVFLFVFEVYFHSPPECTHEISTPFALQAQHPPNKKMFTVQRMKQQKLLFLLKALKRTKNLKYCSGV